MTPSRSGVAVAPDGSPVDAFALLPPGPGPELIASVVPPGGTVLELGCGAGRLLRPLAERGITCTGVDQCTEMLVRAPDTIEIIEGDIETLDLGDRRFDVAVLASFLVNTIDSTQRDQFLATAKRCADAVVVQRLDPELVPIAVDAESEADGVLYEMRDVSHDHDGALFGATMRFTIDGVTYEQRYTGVVLDDAAFEAVAQRAGLRVERYLDGQRTWAVLR